MWVDGVLGLNGVEVGMEVWLGTLYANFPKVLHDRSANACTQSIFLDLRNKTKYCKNGNCLHIYKYEHEIMSRFCIVTKSM